MKITALTSFCVDFFPEKDQVYVGGNSLNFATQCKRSGVEDVLIIGATGKDRFGKAIQGYLDHVKIDRSRLYTIDASTASNKIYLDEQGDRYFKADSWQGGAFDQFRLSEDDWLALRDQHIVAMPAGDPNLSTLLKRRREGQLVVVDFLDYLGIEVIKQVIQDIDVVFLSGKEEMLSELQALAAQHNKLIIPTLGAKGSIAFYGEEKYVQEAIQVDQIVDTTGCGDAFQAALSIAWAQHRDVPQSLHAGAVAASKVLKFMGGVEQ